MHNRLPFILLLLTAALPPDAAAQSWKADVSWYDPSKTWIKLYYVGGTVAEVDVQDLLNHGLPTNTIDADRIHVYERGKEIPLEIEKRTAGALKPGDRIRWIARRQPGMEERWAWHQENIPNAGSGTRSLYADTTVYWLTWDSSPGLRYQRVTDAGRAPFYTGYRDTVYLEKDSAGAYFEGTDTFRDLSSYTDSEGRHWREHNLTNSLELVHPLETQLMTNLLWRVRDSLLTFEARFMGLSAGGATAVKRAHIEAIRDLPDGSGAGYVSLGSTEWNSASLRTVRGTLRTTVMRDTARLNLRIRVENRSPNRAGVNLVNFDWLRFSYYRGFQMPANLVRMGFRLPHDGVHSVRMHKFRPGDTLRVYMPGTGRLYQPPFNAADSTFSFFVDQPSNGAELHIVAKNRNFSKPVRIVRHTFRVNLTDATNEGEFLIITRPLFLTEAQRYAAYRGQQSGLTTLVVTMEDVWDLFDHGARRPIALKRFLQYARTRWNKPPRYVFIIGDAAEPSFAARIADTDVPSFGIPPSDDWYVQNWGGPGDLRTQMAVGRLTARTALEVRQYQSKVRQYERALEPGAWRKRVVMLSGGNSTIERKQLLTSNRTFARIAASSSAAADTIMVGKTSNDPLGLAPRQDLKNILDDGVFMLHFFGHSAPNSWDLLTDDPSAFENVGRPNIVLSLGCYSGRFTSSDTRIISEQFVFAPNAAVAYIGGSGAGQIPALYRYGDYFYQTMFTEDATVLGDVIRRTKVRHFENNQTALIDLALLQNSLLLGDPALRISLPDKPEYLFSQTPYTIRPEPSNVADSLMRVRIDLLNYGRRPSRAVQLRLEHKRPDQTVVEYNRAINPFNLKAFTEIPVKLRASDIGVHQLRTVIDSDGQLDETSKVNNEYLASRQVYATSADILYPAHLGIHNSRTPRMVVASPTFTSGVRVEFQLDTTGTFTAPLRAETVQGNQLAMTWRPDIRLAHNTNYWWRTRIVDEGGRAVTAWRQASYLVDTTRTGTWWAQNRKNFPSNSFALTLKHDGTRFAFSEVLLPVSTESSNYDYGSANNADFTASTRVNGVEYGRRIISFHVLALDGTRGRILLDKQYMLHFGQYATFPVNDDVVTRNAEEFSRDLNGLKNGDYVVMRVRHVQQVFPSAGVSADVRVGPAFSSVGGFRAGNGVNGTTPSQLDGNSGYILFGKKGARSASETSEYIIRDNRKLERDTVFRFNAPGGDMLSEIAGPARTWHELQYQSLLANFTSEASVEVYGLRDLNDETPQLLLKTDRFATGVRSQSLSGINARQFPYLQLKAVMADSSRLSTPQLPFWRMRYEPVPEVALDPFSARIPRDTLQEGSAFDLSIDVHNLSGEVVDTIFVDFLERMNNGPEEVVGRDTLRVVAAGARRTVALRVPTNGRLGRHDLLVRLRTPVPDQYVYNNLFAATYLVFPDQRRPQVELFVDGLFAGPVPRPVTDPDAPDLPVVGAAPVIEIRWKDENELFLLNDPAFLELYFNGERIPADDPRLEFRGATSTANNRAVAFFRPQLRTDRDSIYHITVFARDAAGNNGEGAEGYSISFRFVSQTGIPHLYPYPNPMSEGTRFSFQLFGADLTSIERFRITLFTLNGRPVRVLDLLGDDAGLVEGGLKLGWNRVYYDGRDQDGGVLANGVYLYRVELTAGGRSIPVNNGKSVEKLAIVR